MTEDVLCSPRVAEVAPHVTHLLPGERELLADCHRREVYLTLCGELLPVSALQSSLCQPGCERMVAYCRECLRVAARVNADAGAAGLLVGDDR